MSLKPAYLTLTAMLTSWHTFTRNRPDLLEPERSQQRAELAEKIQAWVPENIWQNLTIMMGACFRPGSPSDQPEMLVFQVSDLPINPSDTPAKLARRLVYVKPVFGGIKIEITGRDYRYGNQMFKEWLGLQLYQALLACRPARVVIRMHGGAWEDVLSEVPLDVIMVDNHGDVVREAQGEGELVIHDRYGNSNTCNGRIADLNYGEEIHHLFTQLPEPRA